MIREKKQLAKKGIKFEFDEDDEDLDELLKEIEGEEDTVMGDGP